MPNIATLLKDEIKRLSRREIRTTTDSLKKASGQHRADVAALKRRLDAVERTLKQLVKLFARSGSASSASPDTAPSKPIRYSAKRFLVHRQRLALSAADAGFLLNVSPQTVYNWETGKTRPSPGQMPVIAAFRKLTKRHAREILNGLRK